MRFGNPLVATDPDWLGILPADPGIGCLDDKVSQIGRAKIRTINTIFLIPRHFLLWVFKVEKNKERLKLEQGDDKVKDGQIAKLIELEREVSCIEDPSCAMA